LPPEQFIRNNAKNKRFTRTLSIMVPILSFPMRSWTDTRVNVEIRRLIHAFRFVRRCSTWRGCVKFGAPNGEDDQYAGAG
jgi:hypothetical protein